MMIIGFKTSGGKRNDGTKKKQRMIILSEAKYIIERNVEKTLPHPHHSCCWFLCVLPRISNLGTIGLSVVEDDVVVVMMLVL